MLSMLNKMFGSTEQSPERPELPSELQQRLEVYDADENVVLYDTDVKPYHVYLSDSNMAAMGTYIELFDGPGRSLRPYIWIHLDAILMECKFLSDPPTIEDDPAHHEIVAELVSYVETHEMVHWALTQEENMPYVGDNSHSYRWHPVLVESMGAKHLDPLFEVSIDLIEDAITVGGIDG